MPWVQWWFEDVWEPHPARLSSDSKAASTHRFGDVLSTEWAAARETWLSQRLGEVAGFHCLCPRGTFEPRSGTRPLLRTSCVGVKVGKIQSVNGGHRRFEGRCFGDRPGEEVGQGPRGWKGVAWVVCGPRLALTSPCLGREARPILVSSPEVPRCFLHNHSANKRPPFLHI